MASRVCDAAAFKAQRAGLQHACTALEQFSGQRLHACHEETAITPRVADLQHCHAVASCGGSRTKRHCMTAQSLQHTCWHMRDLRGPTCTESQDRAWRLKANAWLIWSRLGPSRECGEPPSSIASRAVANADADAYARPSRNGKSLTCLDTRDCHRSVKQHLLPLPTWRCERGPVVPMQVGQSALKVHSGSMGRPAGSPCVYQSQRGPNAPNHGPAQACDSEAATCRCSWPSERRAR